MTRSQNDLNITRELPSFENVFLACMSVTVPDPEQDERSRGGRDLKTLTETFEYPAFVG